MFDERIDARHGIREEAIRAKATGMFLNDDGSTLYLLNGQQVDKVPFNEVSGLGHLSEIGFHREDKQATARSFEMRRRELLVRPVLWNTSLPKEWSAWRSPLKVYAIAVVVRIALRLGYVVVLIGQSRSGKTTILERALPNRILNRKEDILLSDKVQDFGLSLRNIKLPAGHFALDEFVHLDERILFQDLEELGSRTFVVAIQSRSDLERVGVKHWFEARKRIEITLSRI